MGLSQAATVRVGLAAGVGDARGVRLAGWTALALGMGFMALAAAMFVLVPHWIVAAFIDAELAGNAAVFDLAVSFLAIAAAFQLVDGAQSIGAGALRGLKDTRVPMLYAIAGYWGVGFVAAVIFGFALDLDGFGIWIGLGLGLAAVAALMVELELQVLAEMVAVLREISGRRARLQMPWNPLVVVAVAVDTTRTTLRRTIAVAPAELVLFCCHLQCRVKNSNGVVQADPH